MDNPPEWATKRPEDATLAEMNVPTADAPGVRDADETSGSKSDDDESKNKEDEQPTESKRSRRAPSKEADK